MKISEKERLNNSENWFEISLLSNFKVFVRILLGPTDFRERIQRKNNILNLNFINWLYEKRTDVYIRKEMMKFVSRKFVVD